MAYPIYPSVDGAFNFPPEVRDALAKSAENKSAIETNPVVVANKSKNDTQDGRLDAVESKNTTQDGRLTSVESKNTAQDGRLESIESKNAEQDVQLNGLLSAIRTRGSLPAGDLFTMTSYNDNGIYSLNSSSSYTNAPFIGSGTFVVLNDYQMPGLLLAQKDNTGDLWFSKTTTDSGGSFVSWDRLTTKHDINAAIDPLDLKIDGLRSAAVVPMIGEEPYAMLWRDPTGRISEAAAVDAYGNTPEWVLERWSERMSDILKSDMGIKPRTAIAAIGDSLTERYHNIGGQSWTDVLESELGIPVMNLGKSGQSTTEIAVRVGAIPFLATVAGNVIPASGAAGLTAYSPTSFWRDTIANEYRGSLAGVPGVLRQNIGSPVTFHFIRDEAGDPAPCPPNTRFIPEQAKYLKWTPIIWMGRNNIGDGHIDIAKSDIDATVEALPFPESAKRFLVLSTLNASAEPSGTTGYTRVMALNAYLEDKYGDFYVDVRVWLRDNALAAMGLTPTAADTTAIAEDRIPPQLMQDNLHITEAASLALGDYLVTVINSRGLFNPTAPLRDTGVMDITSKVADGAITSGVVTFQHKNGWNAITMQNVKLAKAGNVNLFPNNNTTLKPWAPGVDGVSAGEVNENLALGSAGTDSRRLNLNYTGGMSVYGGLVDDVVNGSLIWPMNRTMP